MKKLATLPRTQVRALGRLPVVILSLDEYEKMKEDLEMLGSKRLEYKIEKARQEVKKGRVVSLEKAMKKLGLS